MELRVRELQSGLERATENFEAQRLAMAEERAAEEQVRRAEDRRGRRP